MCSTHSSSCDGDGDGGEEGEVVSWVNAVPQRRQDEGQSQSVFGGSVVTNPEDDGMTELKTRDQFQVQCSEAVVVLTS